MFLPTPQVESMVVGVCKPNEVDKFRMFIGDLDKVVNLLLSLSARLRRVDGSLDTLDPETEHHERVRRPEGTNLPLARRPFSPPLPLLQPSLSLAAFQLPLLEKKHQLKKQLSEAQDLKDHVDRREQAVSRVLARCLSPEQHRDYWYGAIEAHTTATCFQIQLFFSWRKVNSEVFSSFCHKSNKQNISQLGI